MLRLTMDTLLRKQTYWEAGHALQQAQLTALSILQYNLITTYIPGLVLRKLTALSAGEPPVTLELDCRLVREDDVVKTCLCLV